MRVFIRALDLDIQLRQSDLRLAQFHAAVFSEAVSILEKWARSGKDFGFREASALGELVLRSRKCLQLWRGPSFARVEAVCRLIWQLATIVIKQRGGLT